MSIYTNADLDWQNRQSRSSAEMDKRSGPPAIRAGDQSGNWQARDRKGFAILNQWAVRIKNYGGKR